MKSYRKADKIILELEDDFNTLEEKIFKYAEKDRLKEDQYLNLHLSSESLEKLKQIFDEEKLNQYCQYEAWVLNMLISGARTKLIGYDPLLAIDKYFHDLAEKDGKEIIEEAVSELELNAKTEEPLYKAYFDNDMVQFENEFLKLYDFSKPQVKQIYDRVFTSRNINWIEQFEHLSTENPGTYFVLVGSGHYFGPSNIRELLEHKGYTIEKI